MSHSHSVRSGIPETGNPPSLTPNRLHSDGFPAETPRSPLSPRPVVTASRRHSRVKGAQDTWADGPGLGCGGKSMLHPWLFRERGAARLRLPPVPLPALEASASWGRLPQAAGLRPCAHLCRRSAGRGGTGTARCPHVPPRSAVPGHLHVRACGFVMTLCVSAGRVWRPSSPHELQFLRL